jgi:hypothetical protein
MPTLLLPCAMLIHVLRGEETGVYFMDSTTLAVCHNQRINRNKVFAGLAERGKSSMGWFYGFKLHMVINHQGQIMTVKITKGTACQSQKSPKDYKALSPQIKTISQKSSLMKPTAGD